MPQNAPRNEIAVDGQTIDLKNPALAAFLAWLIPGVGHFYQQRYAKGALYAICILTTYWIGFAIGGMHVVYASWIPEDKRWHYVCQFGVGLPALPALVQTRRLNAMTEPQQTHSGPRLITKPEYEPLWGGLMAPPRRPVIESDPDEISAWYARKGAGYEMGTWYTMIAGLLNILVIYDAYSGPLAIPISGRKKGDKHDEDDEDSPDKAAAQLPEKTAPEKSTSAGEKVTGSASNRQQGS